MRIILLISGIMLFVICATFFVYELFTFRQTTIQKLSTVGKVIATNSTASLAFDNKEDANQILSALKAEPHIVAACLYDKNNNLFSKYPASLSDTGLTVIKNQQGYHFENSYVEGFQPVMEGTRRLGTLYLRSDLGEMYARIRLYGIITFSVIVVSFLLSYLLSKILQKSISQPILVLAETAKTISVNRDYSIRAVKSGDDELGSLTDSFNDMLGKIHEQNQSLNEFNEELARKEKRYRYLFENNPMPMWVIDLTTFKFLDVNQAASMHYGYTREEFLSMTALDIRPDEEKELFKQLDRPAHVNIPDFNRGIWKHLKKDGTLIYAEVFAHEIFFEGKAARLILSNDVTEKIKAEEKLEKYTHELEHANKELEQFAYIASHDLQEPLRMVGSYVQLLEKRYKGKLDNDADEFIHYAVDGANRMKQLISDLLNYSRTSRSERTEVNIADVLNEVQKNLQASIKETSAVINFNGMPVINADRTQMLQLFQNLISNAIKFKKNDVTPVINIGAIKQNGLWLFSVEDNGIGIDEQYSDKVFIIFKQLHDKSKYSGTGIGLAIAKKIAERHGGKIWFESEPGKGTTFYFTLKN